VLAAEHTRTAQLRELLAMQRRRYCEFLSQWHHIVEALRNQATTTNEYSALAHGRDLKALATAASAPAPLPEFRVVRDRTLIPLTNTDATRDLPPGVVCAVRALWDCDAEEDGDLAFRRGDTIYVLAKDNDSGWYTGTLQGRTGIFPACWVVETTPPTSKSAAAGSNNNGKSSNSMSSKELDESTAVSSTSVNREMERKLKRQSIAIDTRHHLHSASADDLHALRKASAARTTDDIDSSSRVKRITPAAAAAIAAIC
jgi:hypothetical protein